MADNEPPQHDHEPEGASASSAAAPADGVPATSAKGSVAPVFEPQGDGWQGLRRLRRPAAARKAMWAAIAGVCAALGVAASVLGAHSVARTDAAKARQAFPRTSTAIASTLALSIQHEQDLIISASTFFAGKPAASASEFDTWVKWAQALRRYPELERLGLVTLVRAAELPAFEARVTGHPAKPLPSSLPLTSRLRLGSRSSLRYGSSLRSGSSLGSGSPSPGAGGLHIVPGGARPYYCFAAVELARSAVKRTAAGVDQCARSPRLLSSRDSGLSVYTSTAVGHNHGLAIETPVYRGNVPPSGLSNRRAAFAGWLRQVLQPGVMLQQVLRGHSDYALRLRHRTSTSNVLLTSGSPVPGAQSRTINLHNGWTIKTFGPAPAGTGMLSDGDARAVLIAGGALSLLVGLLVFLLGTGSAPRRAARTRELPHDDLYDALTGLPNRALMLDRAERMLARAGRQSGLLVGALFIDIDWFKDVNEKLGQAAGDQLLAIVAERLESVVRGHDTIGRLGGDEFVVLVESAARGVRLDSLARRVIEALHKPLELDGFGPSFSLTASIGVAFGRYASPEDLLRDAQLALRAAQTAGRDRYTLFNANMRSVIEGHGVLEVELNTALEEKQFFLLYQPIYDLSTSKLAGLQALLHWRHPTQGALPSDDFDALAEETGLIVPIGRWALEEACSRAAAWNVAGHRVSISVKVSANQLNRDGFLTDVRRALQQSGIEPSLLVLEIAESTLMRDVAVTSERLEEIKRLGVRIAIDDFGSGYAQHSDLQQMSLDFLKVDRGSLAATDDEDYRSWLFQAILVVGRDLSIPVIGTGVETYEQLSALQAMGCPMAQGSFVGAAASADAVESLFEAELPTSPTPSPSLSD
jgi:diguanylate cyclase (GGDEF)-like protein